MSSQQVQKTILVLIGICLASAQVERVSAGDEPLPRFDLKIGLELRYTARVGDWMDGPDGKPKIIREKDGSPKYDRHDLRVFVTGPGKAKNSMRVVMQTAGFGGSPTLTYADLATDGHITRYPIATPAHEDELLRAIFPLLPADEKELRQGWQEFDERSGISTHYQIVGDEIRAGYDGPLERVSAPNEQIKLIYRLGAKSHLPDEIRVNGYWKAYKETVEKIVTLAEVKQHDAAWANQFEAEATRYFQAVAKSRKLQGANAVPLAMLEHSSGAASQTLDRACAELEAAKQTAQEPVFRDVLQSMIKNAEQFRSARLETAKKNAKIAGQLSPAWKATDLDGKEVSIEALRGQVVVIDFWFRQCNFCMRVMPQVEQAAEHFRQMHAPVQFFGASTDKEAADARHVADKLKLSYPVLRAGELAKAYGIGVFPTLLVIDQQGKVRGIFTGYSLTLREDILQCVSDLLNEAKARTSSN